MNPKCWFNVLKNDSGEWYWNFYDRYNVKWADSGQTFSSKKIALENIKIFREMARDAVVNAALDD